MSTLQVAARRGYLTCRDREIGPAGRQVPAGGDDLTSMEPDDAIFDLDLDDEPGGEPDFRATVQRSGAVRLVYWHEWLGAPGRYTR
jgi:hypothetical protein